MSRSPYSILRINPDATPEQIEEAYYRMRRLIGSAAQEHEIQAAYNTLMDPMRKAIADMRIKNASEQVETAPRGGSWLRRLLGK